ncbi:DJ-1/PfpI family protein [Shewanella algae]|uniref:DJ-1/PfpI family protein n=1 Tax=Shewanella algae TaxID=38313 RepID=UPI001C05B580|nr:DJ-1/PfpI family protein [Shewanella algae]QWL09750.1 DJ-1/PfpI family protein [Shewanella algae]
MNRRDFTLSCLGTLAAASLGGVAPQALAAGASGQRPAANSLPAGTKASTSGKPHIAFVLYEGMTALDLIGPAEVLAGEQFDVDFVWYDKEVVYAESRANKRLGLMPTATFAEIEQTNILCVPGTSNPYKQLERTEMIDWVARVGAKADWVTSVCTGSFILGAAGLLKGYKATSHWGVLQDLRYFGAEPVVDRVVHDRNRVTGAGVTSGIDFGLLLLSLLTDEQTARGKQLVLEYDPQPPFNSGSPKLASPALLEAVRGGYMDYLQAVAPNSRSQLQALASNLGIKHL